MEIVGQPQPHQLEEHSESSSSCSNDSTFNRSTSFSTIDEELEEALQEQETEKERQQQEPVVPKEETKTPPAPVNEAILAAFIPATAQAPTLVNEPTKASGTTGGDDGDKKKRSKKKSKPKTSKSPKMRRKKTPSRDAPSAAEEAHHSSGRMVDDGHDLDDDDTLITQLKRDNSVLDKDKKYTSISTPAVAPSKKQTTSKKTRRDPPKRTSSNSSLEPQSPLPNASKPKLRLLPAGNMPSMAQSPTPTTTSNSNSHSHNSPGSGTSSRRSGSRRSSNRRTTNIASSSSNNKKSQKNDKTQSIAISTSSTQLVSNLKSSTPATAATTPSPSKKSKSASTKKPKKQKKRSAKDTKSGTDHSKKQSNAPIQLPAHSEAEDSNYQEEVYATEVHPAGLVPLTSPQDAEMAPPLGHDLSKQQVKQAQDVIKMQNHQFYGMIPEGDDVESEGRSGLSGDDSDDDDCLESGGRRTLKRSNSTNSVTSLLKDFWPKERVVSNRLPIWIGVVIGSAFLIAVIIGLVRRGKNNRMPSQPSTMAPTFAPTSQRQRTLTNRLERTELSNGELLRISSSSASVEAVNWMIYDDRFSLDDDSDNETELVQRYALAAIYHATSGDQWKHDANGAGWLGASSVCAWAGVSCDITGNVDTLDLSQHGLVGTLPTEVGLLTSLTSLEIWTNQQLTGSIPSYMGCLTNLERLYAARTAFEGSIPSELGRLTTLSELTLNYNAITGEVPPELQALTTLRRFYLHSTQVSGALDDICSTNYAPIDFWADCGGDVPEVSCTCCTTCCPGGLQCPTPST